MSIEVTTALAGIGLWLGLALLFVGLVGPLIMRDPAHGKKFTLSIVVGVVLVVAALWSIATAFGGGPDRAPAGFLEVAVGFSTSRC